MGGWTVHASVCTPRTSYRCRCAVLPRGPAITPPAQPRLETSSHDRKDIPVPSSATSSPPASPPLFPVWLVAGTVVTSGVWALLYHSQRTSILAAGAIVALMLLVLAIVARVTSQAPPWSVGHDVWLALPVIVVHLAVSYAAIPIATAILPLVGEQAAALVATATTQWSPMVVALLSALLVAPMEEEFWRGTMQPRLGQVVDHADRPGDRVRGHVSWRAILATTGVFCLFHVPTGNIALIGASLLGGIAWGWLHARTEGMLAPVLAHGTWTAAMALFPPI